MGYLNIIGSANPHHEWDENDPDSVAHCKQLFYDVLVGSSVAWKTNKNGHREQTDTFDPEAEKITISFLRS